MRWGMRENLDSVRAESRRHRLVHTASNRNVRTEERQLVLPSIWDAEIDKCTVTSLI